MAYTLVRETAGEETQETAHSDFAEALDLFFCHLGDLLEWQTTGSAVLCEDGKERLRAALKPND